MKAIRVHHHDGPEVLAYEDIDINPPGLGQVRVRNRAIGVNFVDVYLRSGTFAPPSLSFRARKEPARCSRSAKASPALLPATA